LFSERIGREVERHIPLADLSHFKIGGYSDYFFEASNILEIEKAVGLVRECSVPYYVIGGGYNILFSDEGYKGLLIKNAVTGLRRRGKSVVEAFSGTSIDGIIRFCTAQGLGGLEFMAGIPGTLGGAVYGNAGAFDKDIGMKVDRALVLGENGKARSVSRSFLEFGYRSSRLKRKHDILISADIKIHEQPSDRTQILIEDILDKRKTRHPPWGVACAGSYFKNPVLPSGKKVAAAELLDRVGSKKLFVGDAAVYGSHANFIINKGQACAKDVLLLASEMKKRVRKRFGVELEEEVVFLPADFSMFR